MTNKQIIFGFLAVMLMTRQTETQCFFTEVAVAVLVTRYLYTIALIRDHHTCNTDCLECTLCEKIKYLRARIEDLENRVKLLEQ
ncbi:hypothetical protein K9K77_03075 [Candidatus Babeliales bacterium]|nr:hypothetical protein [Candidatus Babeliales bacterium]